MPFPEILCSMCRSDERNFLLFSIKAGIPSVIMECITAAKPKFGGVGAKYRDEFRKSRHYINKWCMSCSDLSERKCQLILSPSRH